MEIKRDRLVFLGYGKYWKSDQILGLVPIEEDRGAGRRTHVYVAGLAEPIVASRTEEAIGRDMVETTEEAFHAQETRVALADLLDDLRDLSPVVRRVLLHEGGFDVRRWEERLSVLVAPKGPPPEPDEGPDLFHPAP